MDEPLIVGEKNLDRAYVNDLKEWSKKNDERREKAKKQRKRYKKTPALEAYKELQDRKEYQKKKDESGHGRIFTGGIPNG